MYVITEKLITYQDIFKTYKSRSSADRPLFIVGIVHCTVNIITLT